MRLRSSLLFCLMFICLAPMLHGTKWRDAEIKLSQKCYRNNDLDIDCLKENRRLLEEMVYKYPFYSKDGWAESLLRVYLAIGDQAAIDRLMPRLNIYRRAEKIGEDALNEACGCQYVESSYGVTPEYYRIRAYSVSQIAAFLQQQGPDYDADAKSGLKLAKFMASQAHGGGFVQQLGQSINDAASSYNAVQATSNAQAARVSTLPGLPQCTRTRYVSSEASLWIDNSCNTAVTVQFTSDSGKTWGQADIGPGGKTEATAFGIGYNPATDGKVYLFTCPKGSQPVMPNGNPWLAKTYNGQYVCHN